MNRKKNTRAEDEFIKDVDPSELDDPALAPLRELMLDLAAVRETHTPPAPDPEPLHYRDLRAFLMPPEVG